MITFLNLLIIVSMALIAAAVALVLGVINALLV